MKEEDLLSLLRSAASGDAIFHNSTHLPPFRGPESPLIGSPTPKSLKEKCPAHTEPEAGPAQRRPIWGEGPRIRLQTRDVFLPRKLSAVRRRRRRSQATQHGHFTHSLTLYRLLRRKKGGKNNPDGHFEPDYPDNPTPEPDESLHTKSPSG